MSQFLPIQPGTYRGGLVYRQEDGYMMITIMVNVAPGETSHVITHAYNLPILEDVEHLPGLDVYHFATSYNTLIELVLVSEAGTKKAWFVVTSRSVFAFSSPLSLDIVRSSESIASMPEQTVPTCNGLPVGRRGGKK